MLGMIKKREGFTFLEISIVIVILVVLLAIAVPNYQGIKEEAQDSSIKADIATLENAFSLSSVVNSSSMKDLLSSGTIITSLSDINGNVVDPNTIKLYSINNDIARYYKKLKMSLENYLVDESNGVYYKGLFYGNGGGISAKVESNMGDTVTTKSIDPAISGRNGHTSLLYNNKMLLFGGYDGSNRLNEFLEVSLNSGYSSVQKTLTGNNISARSGHTAVLFNDKMIIFGGNDGSRKNDCYEINLNDYSVKSKALSGDSISARDGHTAVVYDGKMVVFGGNDGSRKNDCYEINLSDYSVTAKTLSGDSISAREGHSAVVYNGEMIIFGGYNGTTYNNDCYSINLSTYAVTQRTLTGSAPPVRSEHSAVVCNGKMIIFGGKEATCKNDCYEINLSTYASSEKSLSVAPAQSEGHASVIYNGKMVIFGGYDGDSYIGDCFEVE